MATILDTRPFSRDLPGGEELVAKLFELWWSTPLVEMPLRVALQSVGLTPAEFNWGATMSSLWIDIVVQAAERRVLRNLMEALPLQLGTPSFAAFLEQLPEIDPAAPAVLPGKAFSGPFERRVLSVRRPFIDRDPVREALFDLSTPTGARVLVVDGPIGSGRSHVWFLVADGNKALQPPGRAVRIRPSDWVGDAWGARKLMEQIGVAMEWGAPPALDSKAQGDALLLPLLSWFKAKAVKENRPVWLVIDDLDARFVDEEGLRLAAAVAGAAATSQAGELRVVLLAFSGNLGAEAEDFSERTVIAPIDESLLRSYFREVAESVGEQLTPGAVDAILAEAVGPPPYANPLPLPQLVKNIGRVADSYQRRGTG